MAIASSIAISIRERISEIGVLKSLGFDKFKIIMLIMLESIEIAVIGGLVGCFMAYFLIGRGNFVVDLPPQSVPLIIDQNTIISGIVISLIVGIIGSLPTTLKAVQYSILTALNKVD